MSNNLYDENVIKDEETNVELSYSDLIYQFDNKIDFIRSSVFLNGDIREDRTSYEVISRMQMLSTLKKDNINLIINSSGGDVQEMFAIIDYINQIDIPVNVIARGKCYSGAAMILLSATGARVTTPNTIIMLHEIKLSVDDDISQVKNDTNLTNQQQEIFYDILESKTNKNRDFWLEQIRYKNLYLTAKKSLELGIVQKIL